MQAKAFDTLRRKPLMETSAEDFLVILKTAKVSEAHYLRRLHNLALGLGWLAVPVLAPRLWPKPQYKAKRGITPDEHQRIIAAERNPERSLFYQLLWEVGASQSDAAALAAEDLDWSTRTLTYFRMKTGEQAQMAISKWRFWITYPPKDRCFRNCHKRAGTPGLRIFGACASV